MAEKKKRLSSIEFVRAVCAIGIVVFHLSCHVTGSFKLFFDYANGMWGDATVMLFFMMSGAMLYLNNKETPSLKVFYYKRAKSIYPAFYISYLVFFLWDVFKSGHFFFRPDVSPFTMLLTLFGLDGYLLYAIPNYYILGEWFLGALVLLYLVYPALANGISKRPKVTTFVVTLLYAWILIYNVFEIRLFRNFFSCLFSFYLGMLLFKHKKILENPVTFAVSSAVMLVLALVKLPFIADYPALQNLTEHVMGLCMFISLMWIGEFLTRAKLLRVIFEKLGALSYPIFLVQHQIIMIVLTKYTPIGVKDYTAVLAVILAITLVSAAALKFMTDRFVKSDTFAALEGCILGKNKKE